MFSTYGGVTQRHVNDQEMEWQVVWSDGISERLWVLEKDGEMFGSNNRQKGKYLSSFRACERKGSYHSRKNKVHFNGWKKVRGMFREEAEDMEDCVDIP